jgi:hypothetical protein
MIAIVAFSCFVSMAAALPVATRLAGQLDRAEQMQLARDLQNAQCHDLDLRCLFFEDGAYAVIVQTTDGLRQDKKIDPTQHYEAEKAWENGGIFLEPLS